MAPPAPLPKLEDCLESMKDYLQHYMEVNRPGPLPSYLIICAGHPTGKVLVSIIDKEQFENMNRENDQVMIDDEYEMEMYWIARSKKEMALKNPPPQKESKKAKEMREKEEKMTEQILRYDILSKPKPKQTLNFNGVKYEIIMKDSAVAKECWCNEEKFRSLFMVDGTRGQADLDDESGAVRKVVPNVIAKDEVLFFDLIKVKNEKPDEEAAAFRAEAEEKKRKGDRKAKKDRQKAKKEAAKVAEQEAKKKAVAGKEAVKVEIGEAAKEPETAS